MKFKLIVFVAVLSTALTLASFANNRPFKTAKNIINEFAESHVNTDATKLSRLLSEDVILKFSKGDEVLTQNQTSIMKQAKQNDGVIQNCSTRIEFIASSEALVIAQVNFIYEEFIIENFITIELDKNQGWKITRINKFFSNALNPSIITRR